MRALIIEDDRHLLEQLKEHLASAGLVVDTAADGREGCHMAIEYPLDVAVIDLGLPHVSGLEIIKATRAAGRRFPILILTARTRWQDKVAGLEAGADDYLVKPFHPEELLARLRALLRRTSGWAQPLLICGPVRLDISSQAVMLDGRPVALTGFEYRVLEYLMLHAGEVVSKTTLTEHLYAEDGDRDSNVIEVFVRRLRRKLDPDGRLAAIETLRGRGYRFTLPRQEPEA
ncbi:response regulator transcription factor [Nitrococcus mobilis]|uniref:Two-component system regulatory protein n=1 Tax=Nitrococcus mobilis Nb-231 TaxID=314278 RepID=A4BSS4_9GAMM|nr:response regulator transcription factor [Nitrococcus mobilis]EAR21168.1 two-component system regulatory protein [Nitrococcus mobilis Nb-231]